MTEALGYQPTQFRREFIQTDADLRQCVPELLGHDAIGVDLEMGQRVERKPGGLQEWIHLLALIQISTEELSVVIDPLRCGDLSPLAGLMAGSTRKVFLGGGQDVALLERAGLPVRTVVDVGEIALGIFGRREDGMAALAHRIFGISLDKSVRRADWLARPLNAALVTYAHRDAELTLLIYRWFQQHYPEATGLHERAVLEPELPREAPLWLRETIRRPASDVLAVAMEHGFRPERDVEVYAAALGAALDGAEAPRQINRLLRIASELGLKPVLPRVHPFVSSPSSLLRTSAARTIGQLAEKDEGLAALEVLKQDPVEEVRRAAEAAARDLRKPRVHGQERLEEADQPQVLADSAMAALDQLRKQLESAE